MQLDIPKTFSVTIRVIQKSYRLGKESFWAGKHESPISEKVKAQYGLKPGILHGLYSLNRSLDQSNFKIPLNTRLLNPSITKIRPRATEGHPDQQNYMVKGLRLGYMTQSLVCYI